MSAATSGPRTTASHGSTAAGGRPRAATAAPEPPGEVISPRRLYRMWEEGNWSATALNFEADVEHWRARLTPRQRDAALWNYAMFLVGEEAVARTLSPILDAVDDHDDQAFLATQIVDEARHHVFFDRFLREVAGVGEDPSSTLTAVQDHLTWGFRQVFGELDRITAELRRRPRDRALLAQAVALYHFVVEGMLATASQHFIQRYIRSLGLLPGFAEGMARVARDESRHVAFGVWLLGGLVQRDDEARDAAIALWERVLPWAAGVFVPPGMDTSYAECFGFTIPEILAFGLRSFETKVRRAGIEPRAVPLLAAEPEAATFEERGERLWTLVRDRILGTDDDPEPTERSLELILEAAARVMHEPTARSLGGPVQWEFRDGPPYHVVAVGSGLEARRGRAAAPALTIECSVRDWARIVMRRSDPRLALLAGRIRIHGPIQAKVKLPRLFDHPVLRPH